MIRQYLKDDGLHLLVKLGHILSLRIIVTECSNNKSHVP